MNFTVKRSAKRRKLTITVERDRSIVVHAPTNTTEEMVKRAVESKRRWLHEKTRHQQKYQELPHPPGKELVSGESALYLGRSYQIEVVNDGTSEVRFERRFIVPASRVVERKGAMQAWYLARAGEVILSRVNRHARDLGVRFSKAKIVDNRYRWGSCTVRDNISFNWRLIKAPMFVIDYVIVHELAHLIVSNHTPRFWNIVRTQAPKVEHARTWLREHGAVLEEEL